MDEEELLRQAEPLLMEIGKLLYTAAMRHPGNAGRSVGQIKTMAYLYHRGRCTVGEVAAGLGVSMPAASEMIDRLVEDGRIDRRTNPADRRQVLVDLTPEARAFGAEMQKLRRKQLRGALDRLEPAERPIFLRSLSVLAEAMRAEACSVASEGDQATSSTESSGTTAA